MFTTTVPLPPRSKERGFHCEDFDENDIWFIRHVKCFLCTLYKTGGNSPASLIRFILCPTGDHLSARIFTATDLLMAEKLFGTFRQGIVDILANADLGIHCLEP